MYVIMAWMYFEMLKKLRYPTFGRNFLWPLSALLYMLKDYYLEGVKGKIYYFNVRFEIVSAMSLFFLEDPLRICYDYSLALG